MKKILYILAMAVMVITSCQQSPKSVPVDTEAVKAEITALADQFYTAFKAKDVNAVNALLTQDALVCGTDPSEFWNKQQLSDFLSPMSADTSVVIDYSIMKREIKVAADGKSALVIEQVVFAGYSPRFIIRNIFNVEKANENWMIGFLSWNIVVNNEDAVIVNAALQ